MAVSCFELGGGYVSGAWRGEARGRRAEYVACEGGGVDDGDVCGDVKAPEQPFAEGFIYNAVRKTIDQGQLELVKSGNRKPGPVTTRFYSPWKKRFNFNDTTEAQRQEYLAAKVFWLSGVLGGGQPVWVLDPRMRSISTRRWRS